MRQMILNSASLVAPDQRTAACWLKGVVYGMAQLRAEKLVDSFVRSNDGFYNIPCSDGTNVGSPYHALIRAGERDAANRIMEFQDKSPLTADLSADIVDRFKTCEATGCPPVSMKDDEGKPLLLCVFVGDGISVSFPSQEVWTSDRTTVTYLEVQGDGADIAEVEEDIAEVEEDIDNLSCIEHAEKIIARHRESLRECSSFPEMWERRDALFPHLYFGNAVESQLKKVNASLLTGVIRRLTELDQSAGDWVNSGGSKPIWQCNVNPESPTTMNVRRHKQARTFPDRDGLPTVYEWHAYVGHNRIHLVFDPKTREVEIGYVGKKLPPYRRHSPA